MSKAFTGIELEGEAAASGSDFEALYNLARLAYREEIDDPEQLKLWYCQVKKGKLKTDGECGP